MMLHFLKVQRANSTNIKHMREQLNLLIQMATDQKTILRTQWNSDLDTHRESFARFPLKTLDEVLSYGEDTDSIAILQAR